MKRGLKSWALVGVLGLGGFAAFLGIAARIKISSPVSSGHYLTPTGEHVSVGSFPCNMVLTPDHKYAVVTDSGFREQLSVIDTTSGALTDSVEFNGRGAGKKEALYYGLAWGESAGSSVLFVSCGVTGTVQRFTVSTEGKLTKLDGDFKVDLGDIGGVAAGIGYDASSKHLFVALNGATVAGDHHGAVDELDATTGKLIRQIQVPGYPLDVLCKAGTAFVTCERDGVVVPVRDGVALQPIRTGGNPSKLMLSPDGNSLWVSNSGSDTIAQLDPTALKVRRTILLRPDSMRGLPVSTPLGFSFAEDGASIYVALGDLNAVAIVDLPSGKMRGLVPTGWYPSSTMTVGNTLFVASAKGINTANPNGKPAGPSGKWGQYAPNILEGTVSKIDIGTADHDLKGLTAQVLLNNRLPVRHSAEAMAFRNPGITHVIYVIKENRTYDQVFGDIPTGNGDPSLTMFGEKVTPNQHALAKRFALLDNFYDCAEVSGDGWNWSTSGMVNEYTARNIVTNYSGRRKGYDYEGTPGDTVPNLEGLNDVVTAPGGYLWDAAAKRGVTFRNYGFFVASIKADGTITDGDGIGQVDAVKQVLKGHTDTSFPQFDLDYPDSDLFKSLGVKPEGQKASYGAFKSTSRMAEWKREFDAYVQNGDLPQLEFIRLPRDHTAGTSAGQWSPRAMVADNDYAVGQLVDWVSHSKYWKSTAICVIEDDAQDGFDHVDCHRSTAMVITPWMERGRHDSRFYNTDSMLKTIEVLLGLPPMNVYDATADQVYGISRSARNAAPFEAMMPDRAIASEINSATAYRAADSARLIKKDHEESAADLELNDILWGALMTGKSKPALSGFNPHAARVDRD